MMTSRFLLQKPSVWTRGWHFYRDRPRSILNYLFLYFFWIWICSAINISKISIINNDCEFCSSYKYIYPEQLELKLENQGQLAQLRILYLYISILAKSTSFCFLLYVFFIFWAVFHHQHSMVQYCQSSYK